MAFREVFVPLELEGLSYKGIAEVLGDPNRHCNVQISSCSGRDLSNGNTREGEATNRAHRRALKTGQESQSINEELSESVTNEDADLSD